MMTIAETLSGLVRDVHSDQDARVDYQTLKDAILRAYGVTATSCRSNYTNYDATSKGIPVSTLGKCRPFCAGGWNFHNDNMRRMLNIS